MSSLPKPEAGWVPMTIEQLEAIYGTPAFEEEYRRQMRAVAEHDRKTNHADRIEPDWAALDRVWR